MHMHMHMHMHIIHQCLKSVVLFFRTTLVIQ